MLKLLSFFSQVHCTKFSNIRINQTRTIGHQKLNMIMFPDLWFFLMERVFTLHSQVRDNGIFVQFQYEIFPVSVDLFKSLTQQSLYILFRFYLFYDSWIIQFYRHDLFWFRLQQNLTQKFSYSLNLRKFRHFSIDYKNQKIAIYKFIIENIAKYTKFDQILQQIVLLMSHKHHHEHKNRKESCGSCDHDHQHQDDDASQVDVEEEIIKKIKALPTLKEKVQTIAINSYLIQKRQLDQKLGKEIEEIEQKFRKLFNPYIQEISKIIQGKHAFTDIDFQQIGELLTQEEMSNKHNYFNNEKIPQYWLKVLINSQSLGEYIQEKDQPLLKHLQRIQGHRAQDLSKLSLIFYFSPNQWFSNQKLEKNFDIKGDQITKSYGDQIHWKQGKNITIKIIKKKGKKGGQKKTKEVKQKSFFNFFKDIEIDSQQQEQQQVQQEDEETDDVEQLQRQYQIAQSIYDDLIPKSLQYYLNIVGSADFEGEDFDEEEEEEEVITSSSGKEKNKK